jgi:hypothetical protein
MWKAALEMLKRMRGRSNELDWLLTDDVQVSEGQGRQQSVQLVIGLDFGTSFTKVVIGESRKHYAVPFQQYSLGENPYLLPSALSVLSELRECVLGNGIDASDVYDNLKTPLIERDFSDEVQARAAAFLGLALRHARGWLFETHGKTYRNRTIEWFVNVGLPTDSYDDDELIVIYRRIVCAAWRISALPGAISLKRAMRYISMGEGQLEKLPSEFKARLLPDDRITAFPEFTAQIAGYVQSPRRQDDLHAMVDVGGGTLDVTIFNVIKSDGADNFPIFARGVEPLGARYLITRRLEGLSNIESPEFSPFENLPDDDDFIERYDITAEKLNRIDENFRRAVQKCLSDALVYTKLHRYPRSPQWQPGVPAFFCGGGASAEFYSKLLHGYENLRSPYKLREVSLPVPADLDMGSAPGHVYSRLAVAYGLSFDPFDIGQIVRMNQVKDMPREESSADYRDRYIGKEMT